MSQRRSFDPAPGSGLPAPLALVLLTVATALHLLFLLVAWYRRGGMTEREEWRIYVEGWAFVPILSLVATGLIGRAVARRGDRGAERSWILAFASVAVLLLGALGLRGGAAVAPRIVDVLEGAVVVAYPLGVVAALGVPAAFAGAWSRLVPIATICLWAVLIAVVTLPDPQVPSVVAVLVVALGASVVVRGRTWGRRGWGHVVDAVVLVAVPMLLFDPRLPFDVHHHDWFLGPVNAVMHGRTILVDAFTPYGVLLIEFLAIVFDHGLVPMSYVGLALVMTILLVVQFVGVYVLLRFLCGSIAVAVAALVVGLVVNVAPAELTKYPSSGPLRFGLPWLLPLLVVVRTRLPSSRGATYVADGLVVGLASIWDVQTLLATLATWGGVVLAETAFAVRDASGWLRPTLGRLACAGLLVACAHVILAAFVVQASGEWPQWGTFLALVRSFSPEGEGWALFLAPAWGGWVALVVIYLGSIFAALAAGARVRTRLGAARITVACSVTLMGVAQLSYYVGLSLFPRLYNVALPAIVVGAFWADRWLGRDGASLSEPARAGRMCLLVGAMLWAGHFEASTRVWLGHSAIPAVAAAVTGGAIPAPEGCPSLAACLRDRYPTQPGTRDALALIARYAPEDARLGVFLSTRATTETLVLSDRSHVFPLMDASHDGLSAINMDRIAAAPHGLRAGDVIFVDRARMAAPEARLSRVQNGDPFLRRLMERVCSEFRCVPGEQRGAVTVMRLAPRG